MPHEELVTVELVTVGDRAERCHGPVQDLRSRPPAAMHQQLPPRLQEAEASAVTEAARRVAPQRRGVPRSIRRELS